MLLTNAFVKITENSLRVVIFKTNFVSKDVEIITIFVFKKNDTFRQVLFSLSYFFLFYFFTTFFPITRFEDTQSIAFVLR